MIRPGSSHGLDFVNLDELRKRTGIQTTEVFKWAISEMLCNSLDTDAGEISVEVKTINGFNEITVKDNGTKKITKEDLELILDFSNKASSKRGLLNVSRGSLGNALKCIFGYSYSLAENKGITAPAISVTSYGEKFTFVLTPNVLTEVIESIIYIEKVPSANYNAFTIRFPLDYQRSRANQKKERSELINEIKALESLIITTSIVNPERRINYNLWETKKGSIGETGNPETLRKTTSILWYTPEQFKELFIDYVRARPTIQLKEFFYLFRGFTGRKIQKEILQKLNTGNQHSQNKRNMQFFPTSHIRNLTPRNIEALYQIMEKHGKPISKRSIQNVLGEVGEKSLEKVRKQRGWLSLKYTLIKDRKQPSQNILKDRVSYPFLIELAVFDRKEDDEEGLKVYQCVNFMASQEKLFSRFFDVGHRLGQVGISSNTPVTILIHLVCPVLEWLNYAKTSIGGKHIEDLMKKAFNRVLPIPRKPKKYQIKPPQRPVSWVPRGKITTKKYREKLETWAQTLKYLDSQRGTILKKLSGRGWGYLLEGLNKIDKNDFDACTKAINDCIKLGYLPIDFTAKDQDPTRSFSGIHEALDPSILLTNLKENINDVLGILPHHTTDYWIDEKYYLMMAVEKIDIYNLFEPICREYNIPIVNSRGWYTLKPRNTIAELCKKAEARGLKPVLLLFYDHDITGLLISNKFRKGLRDMIGLTNWDPSELIIDRFGLNYEDIEKHGLTWIPNLKSSKGKDPDFRRKYVLEYISMFGVRKCEANALTRNDETLRIGQQICRDAIEKYYGQEALERFKRKREEAKLELSEIYGDPMWGDFQGALDKTIERYEKKEIKEKVFESEKVYEVSIYQKMSDDQYLYGVCPVCWKLFDYGLGDIDKLVRCRECNASLRLKRSMRHD